MSRYRNVEVSDPQYEKEHLRYLTFKSDALRTRGDVTIFVPPGCEGAQSLPLVLLLHGVYGSHWSWAMRGGAHVTALRLIERQEIQPLVILMPSDGLWGDGSAYLPHAAADYERWVMEDVIGCSSEVVSCIDSHSPLFIGGLSMGGYGALRLGAKYPERVSGFSGHSSVTDPRQLMQFVEEPLSFFGRAAQSEEALPLYWIARHRDRLPPFRFDCGIDDALVEENRTLHQELTQLGIPHEYAEFAGGHNWDYWREHIKDTLLFFNTCLR
jgi:putative tributyrin esterase